VGDIAGALPQAVIVLMLQERSAQSSTSSLFLSLSLSGYQSLYEKSLIFLIWDQIDFYHTNTKLAAPIQTHCLEKG
jgi:hypothetical protein